MTFQVIDMKRFYFHFVDVLNPFKGVNKIEEKIPLYHINNLKSIVQLAILT